jgi:PPOX class probable F420-dependent enzyme
VRTVSTVSLDRLLEIAAQDHYLAIVSTLRAEGSIHSSLVNAGALPHPRTGERCLAFVTYGRTKLANLARRPDCTLAFRAGWQWAAADGIAEIIGPGETDAESLRLLLRDVFTAAGGTHDDWDSYDRVMRQEGRVAVTVAPTRVYGN